MNGYEGGLYNIAITAYDIDGGDVGLFMYQLDKKWRKVFDKKKEGDPAKKFQATRPFAIEQDSLDENVSRQKPVVKPESTEKRSDRDPTAAATAQELEKQGKALEADVADLRELLSLQGDVTRKDSHILSAAQYLSTYHGVIGKQDPKIHKELARLLKDFYSYLDTSEDLSWDNIAEKAKPVAEWIFKHTEAGRQKSEFARNVLADIRSKQIRLTEAERVQAAEGRGLKNTRKRKVRVDDAIGPCCSQQGPVVSQIFSSSHCFMAALPSSVIGKVRSPSMVLFS